MTEKIAAEHAISARSRQNLLEAMRGEAFAGDARGSLGVFSGRRAEIKFTATANITTAVK